MRYWVGAITREHVAPPYVSPHQVSSSFARLRMTAKVDLFQILALLSAGCRSDQSTYQNTPTQMALSATLKVG